MKLISFQDESSKFQDEGPFGRWLPCGGFCPVPVPADGPGVGEAEVFFAELA